MWHPHVVLHVAGSATIDMFLAFNAAENRIRFHFQYLTKLFVCWIVYWIVCFLKESTPQRTGAVCCNMVTIIKAHFINKTKILPSFGGGVHRPSPLKPFPFISKCPKYVFLLQETWTNERRGKCVWACFFYRNEKPLSGWCFCSLVCCSLIKMAFVRL